MPRIPPIVKQVIRHAQQTGENGPLYITFADGDAAHLLCMLSSKAADAGLNMDDRCRTVWQAVCRDTIRGPRDDMLNWAITGIALNTNPEVACDICAKPIPASESLTCPEYHPS